MKNILFIFIIISLISCATIKEKYISNKEFVLYKNIKSYNPEVQLEIKNFKDKTWGELSSPYIISAKIIGNISYDKDNNITLLINSMKIFTCWDNGWTNAEIDAMGSIKFIKNNDKYKAQIIENFEILDVTKGEIRYNDTYYKDNDGLTKVKNKIDRIKEVVKFLKTKNFKEYFGDPLYDSVHGDSFKKVIQNYLFPELEGFSRLYKKKLLTKEFDIKILDSTNDYILSSDILWRNSYTKTILPDYLQDIRNSGSMFTDFEETLDIFFVFYNLDYFFNKVLINSDFILKK